MRKRVTKQTKTDEMQSQVRRQVEFQYLSIADSISELKIPNTQEDWEQGRIPWMFPSLELVRRCTSNKHERELVPMLVIYLIRAENEWKRYRSISKRMDRTDEQIEIELQRIDKCALLDGEPYVEGKVHYSGITRDELLQYERALLVSEREEARLYDTIAHEFFEYWKSITELLPLALKNTGRLKVSTRDFGEWACNCKLQGFDISRAKQMSVALLSDNNGKPYTPKSAQDGQDKYNSDRNQPKEDGEQRQSRIDEDLRNTLDQMYKRWTHKL